jgi:hypothetical protein
VVGRLTVALLLAMGAGFVVAGAVAVRRFRETALPGADVPGGPAIPVG